MRVIEIDGVSEWVWRCRASVSWRTAGVFPFSGGDWAESLRTDASAPDQLPRDHHLEILLTDTVLLCWLFTAVEAVTVVSIDTVNGQVGMKSGEVVPAKISRRVQLAEEERMVREERVIMAMTGQLQATRLRQTTARQAICVVCGWGHDAGFSRIEIPGRAVIALHGVMAQIVALVHGAQASGAGAVSTKDERLLKICGGYRHPCKVFDDLGRREVYQVLFDTSRRGFLGLRGRK